MSQRDPEQDQDVTGDLAVQRDGARIALAGVNVFAFAGSGAIREHGVIGRPTEDVDLFTTSQDSVPHASAPRHRLHLNRVSTDTVPADSSASGEVRAHPATVNATRPPTNARRFTAQRDVMSIRATSVAGTKMFRTVS